MKNRNLHTKSSLPYEMFFEKSPMPIHSMNVSEMLKALSRLKQRGIRNIQQYLAENSNFIQQHFTNTQVFNANEAMLRLVEAESKIHYLDNFKKVFGNACLDFFKKMSIALFYGKENFKDELALITFKGNKKYVEVHTVCYQLPDKAIINWTFVDITEKRKAMIDWQHSQHRYKQLFTSQIIGTAVTNKNFQFTEVNEAFCKMIGYSKSELLNMGFLDVTVAENVEKSILLSRKLFAGEILDFTIYKSYQRKDGSIFHAKTFVKGIYDEYGDFVSSLASILDITEQQETEKALMGSEQRYRLLFENAFEGIIIYNINQQKVVNCNDKALELFGIKRKEDFLNTPLLEYSPRYQPCQNASSKVLLDNLLSAMTHGKVEYEWLHKRADGRLFYTRKYDIRLKTENEELFISIIKDITERKQAENALIQKNLELKKYIESNTQLENFAYIASHDLKAPIRTIHSFAQLLSRRLKQHNDKRAQEYLDFILSGSKNMKELVEALLEYSRVNTQQYIFRPIVPADVINNVLHGIQTSIRDKKASINIHHLPAFIQGDFIKLKQLFQNLITNGIKFQKPNQNAIIDINCVERPTAWEFSIKDNGIGIKPVFFDKIFGLFNKLNNQSEYSGTGIGLAICKTIVEQHGGRIWLESEYGTGTTFYFTIRKEL